MTMQHCLITGAAGFIGSHLARRLLEMGMRVTGVDNFDPFYDRSIKLDNLRALECDRFTFHEADIRDAAAMRKAAPSDDPPDVVFHLAALAGVRPSIEQPARYTSVNLDGLNVTLEAARAAGCRRVIFASSSSVYGNNAKIPFAEEDRVDEPISPYAATKAAGELICRVYAARYHVSIASIRFFTVFGPGQRPDLAISKFMRRIARGEPIPVFGDGSSSRDYTYIDDIIQGLFAAAEKVAAAPEGFFRIYNLGGSDPITLTEMIRTIERVVGRDAVIERLPMQPGDVNRTYADLARSRAELNYRPGTTFAEGVARQWSWFQSRME